jgi:ribosomal protein S18 acetylase RimI-like enzyme
MVTIRSLSLDDMDAAARIHRAALSEVLPRIAAMHTADEDRAFYREQLFAECQVQGAFQNDALVGFIALQPGWVMQLHVDPAHQRQGVGTALLEGAKASQDRLTLWAFQANGRARLFYEKQGFVVVEETDGATNAEREPDVRYRWDRS